ncbi:MAG: DUF3795 domain-containing protein [Candidatus Aminicenantales bacterium]
MTVEGATTRHNYHSTGAGERKITISNKQRNLVGCCGLYCGLCSKYQSKAPSRCIGCKLGEQHSWCSIWNCCVKKHGFETCAECGEISSCAIFLKRKVREWIPAADNLRQIKEGRLENWLEEQKERQGVLEKLLDNYNEGRSMAFYCKVCARMPVELINTAMDEAKKKTADEKIERSDLKSKAKIMRAAFKGLAAKANIRLA